MSATSGVYGSELDSSDLAPETDTRDLTGDEIAQLRAALRMPRGRYAADRASQLSGVPKSTLYWWARNDYLRPDFHGERPMMWSYRDLVFARLFTYLRVRRMPLLDASRRVHHLQEVLATLPDEQMGMLHSDGHTLLLGDELVDRLTGVQVLQSFSPYTQEFDLLAPLEVLRGQEPSDGERRRRRRHLWGPDLARPTPLTRISPWVMAGDPCIKDSRVPTSAVWALRYQRGLSDADIAKLYPGIDGAAIREAIELEDRLRHHRAA